MDQINIEIPTDERQVLQAIAELKGLSLTELVMQAVLKEITPMRVDLAFQLLKEGKIGFKRAWTLSGLSYHEFMVEWSQRGAEEIIPEDATEKELDLARNIDLKRYLRVDNQPI